MFERRQALEYRIAAIEHRKAVIESLTALDVLKDIDKISLFMQIMSLSRNPIHHSSFNSSFIIQFIIHHLSFIIHSWQTGF
ncbi:hypothetical protein [Fidelibacter multiformis]|uniref:hypothetical protein n=1 Tax=Fidelibacter multiformis TaxID=3377529 RepID=UPI0037DCFA7D